LIVTPYGVEPQRFEPAEHRHDGPFRAIFVGSCQARKGIHYLIDAWRKLNLPNAELLVCGEVVPEMKKILEEKSIESVRWLGHVPVKDYLKQAHVFVFPSLEEGSALCTYEAMASSLPLIVTPNSGSIIRDGQDGFVIPIRDVSALTEKIEYFYRNREAARAMGKSAREQVENYTWYLHGERLVKACLEAFSSRKK
jgi:glycosyltransferase involved in cell wall biosynthesis